MAFLPQHRKPGTPGQPYGIELGNAFGSLFKDTEQDSSMAVDGSVTPQVFRIDGQPDERHGIITLVFQIETFTAPRPGLFGDLPALMNGVNVNIDRPNDVFAGQLNQIPFRTNEDFYFSAPDFVKYEVGQNIAMPGAVSIVTRTQPAHDAFVLPENFGMSVTINDDLTGLRNFRVAAFGRRLVDFINRNDN